ncbi:Tex11 [Acrasis kona]|uniref:Tex11 n=1 Tax=Acrasis kona TaxID=1008807 RepID=A0AAW2ZR02_9EUKA
MANQVIEELRNNSNLSMEDRIPLSYMTQFHTLLWNLGVSTYKDKDYKSSLEWSNDHVNKSKTLRFIGRIHLHLNQLDEALIAAKDAERLDDTCFQTLFLLFQIQCKNKNVKDACHYLKKASSTEDFNSDYFALAAQESHENDQDEIAMEALESLLKTDGNKTVKEKGTILRHLVSISHKLNDHDKVNHYLKIMVDLLRSKGARELFKQESVENELEWFHRVSWNNAIEHIKYAWEFYLYKESSKSILESQKICIMTRIMCSIELNQSHENDKSMLLNSLSEIEKCKRICSKLSTDSSKVDKALPVLLLCELKIKLLLERSNDEINELIKMGVSTLDQHSPLDMIIGILIDAPKKYIPSYVDAIKLNIQKLTQQTKNTQYDKMVRLYRRWISACNTREDSIEPTEQVIQMLNNMMQVNENVIPLDELKYITTDAWNNAVYFYKLMRFGKAEKWMVMSMSLSSFLPLDDDLRRNITNGYNSTLQKIQAEKESNK